MKTVQSPGSNPPAFVVPAGVRPIDAGRLEQAKLIEFYKLNKGDFFAAVVLVYDIVMKANDAGAVLKPQQGFNSFCELLTEYLMAAPGETELWSKDDSGRNVNFFGKALMQHFNGRPIQDLYAYDGPKKHETEWQYVYALVRFAAIDAFREGVPVDSQGIIAARLRISELASGQRQLKSVVDPIFSSR